MKKTAILFLSTFLIPLALQPASFASADNRDEGVVAYVHPDYNPHDEGTLKSIAQEFIKFSSGKIRGQLAKLVGDKHANAALQEWLYVNATQKKAKMSSINHVPGSGSNDTYASDVMGALSGDNYKVELIQKSKDSEDKWLILIDTINKPLRAHKKDLQPTQYSENSKKAVYNARVVIEFSKAVLEKLAEDGIKKWIEEKHHEQGKIISTYPIE